jgi:hypothetical protein
MSDNLLQLVPTDPQFQPSPDAAERARTLLPRRSRSSYLPGHCGPHMENRAYGNSQPVILWCLLWDVGRLTASATAFVSVVTYDEAALG